MVAIFAEILTDKIKFIFAKFGHLFLLKYIFQNGLLHEFQILTRLFHDLHCNLRFLTNVLEQLPLGIINQAVITINILANFTLINSTVPIIIALLTFLLLIIVILQ